MKKILTLMISSFIGIPNISYSADFLLTTDTNQCAPESDPVIAVPGGSSLEVLQSAQPDFINSGFNIGTLSANQDVFTCISGQTAVDTPEEEALDQASSSAVISLNASIIQTNNIFTRLATLRGGQGFGFNFFNAPLSSGKKANGGGASADDEGGLLDNRLSGFINGNITIGKNDKSKYTNGFDFDTKGITLGADYRITDNLFIGTAFGYTASNTEINNKRGQVDADSYSLSIYSTYASPSNFYVDILGRVGWNEYIGDRRFNASSDNSLQHAKSSYSGNDYSISFGSGYNYNIKSFNINPLVRFDYTHNIINGYDESGSSIYAADRFRVKQQKIDSMRTALGVEFNYAFSTSYAVIIPTIRAEWQHEFMNDSRNLTTFNKISSNLSHLKTESPDRDFANLGFGVSTSLPHGISAFFLYNTMLANHSTTSHSFNGGIRMEF